MKNLMLRLLILLWLFTIPGQVWGGTWTTNGFIYKPALGARGATEKEIYDTGQDRIDARLGKEIWVGDPNYGTTFQDAVTAIGSNPATLRVPAGTYAITSNLTIPANICLRVERGAVFSVGDGVTLTINGPLQAGLYQAFSCTGTGKVVFGSGAVQDLYPEWWGDTTGADASGPLQAALTCASNSGNTSANYLTVRLSGATYKILSGLSLDAARTSLDFNGSLIDASGMTSGAAITVAVTNNDVAAAYAGVNNVHQRCSLRNGSLFGPGKTSSVTGIFHTTATGLVAFISLENITVNAFGTGELYGQNSFNIQHHNFNVYQCGTGINSASASGGGEEETYFGGNIGECNTAVLQENANGGLVFNSTSFDYNYDKIVNVVNGRVELSSPWIEGNSVSVPYSGIPIIVGSAQDSKLIIRGGAINNIQTLGASGVSYLIQCDTPSPDIGVILDGVFMNNTRTTTDELTTGVGRVIVKNRHQWDAGGGWINCSFLHNSAGNGLLDPSFELSSVLDAYISRDDGGSITSRVSSTHMSLAVDATQHHTGAQSLKVVKTLGIGNGAAFSILIPITDHNKSYAYRLWYKKPGSETGHIEIYTYYAHLLRVDDNGLPVIDKGTSSLFGTGYINFTSDPVDWTQAGTTMSPRTVPPTWATHFLVTVDFFYMDAGTYYFDDVLMSGY